MNLVKIIIVGVVLFGISGVLAYLVDSIMLRYFGTIGRYESLLEYFKKIDQKNGNKVVVIWSITWVILMILFALIIYVCW